MTTLNKIKTISFVLIMCLTTKPFICQNNQNPQNREAMKIAFFTSKMQLNSIESQKFWPLINEMEAEIKALEDKNAHGRMMLIDKEEISDKELEKVMDARMEMGKKQMDIKIKYHEKFKEILPIKKVAKYYESTREFKKIQAKKKSNRQGIHK